MGVKRQERVQRIIELLEERGRLETAVLAHELGVTELTVRRDIDQLDAQGIVRRVYGGAMLNIGRSFEPPYAFRLQRNVAAKRAMAREAVAGISRGANIALDFGTKSFYVAQEMRRRRLQVLVAPTSVQTIEVLGQDADIHVLVPGGEIKPVELSFYGSVTEQFFRDHRWDVAIVSVAGIDVGRELLSDLNESDARLKSAMVDGADRVIVLAEARHIGTVSFAPVCALDRISTVVTDAAGPNDTLDALELRGIDVIRVAPEA